MNVFKFGYQVQLVEDAHDSKDPRVLWLDPTAHRRLKDLAHTRNNHQQTALVVRVQKQVFKGNRGTVADRPAKLRDDRSWGPEKHVDAHQTLLENLLVQSMHLETGHAGRQDSAPFTGTEAFFLLIFISWIVPQFQFFYLSPRFHVPKIYLQGNYKSFVTNITPC